MASKRLFFAIWPDATVLNHIKKLVKKLPLKQGRRVKIDNLHITLSFVGNADEDFQNCLKRYAKRVEHESFDIVLENIGYFENSKVLWVGPNICPPSLLSLVKELNCQLQECGYCPDLRSFKPHMTLFRKALPLLETPHFKSLLWHVSEFCLVESISSERGVVYKPIEQYSLSA